MIENIKSRKIYRICTDAENKVWDRINFLTNAASVDAADGQSLEDKVGQIKGITDATNVTETGYAADAKTVSELSNRMGEFSFIKDPWVVALKEDNSLFTDDDGNYILADSATGQSLLADSEKHIRLQEKGNFFNTGADTVTPFKSKTKKILIGQGSLRTNTKFYISEKYKGYKKLTLDDFVLSYVSVSLDEQSGNPVSNPDTYDPTTGILTIGARHSASVIDYNDIRAYIKYNVYLYC